MRKSRRIRSTDEKSLQNYGGMRLSGENRYVGEEDIKMDLKFVGWKEADRTHLPQDTDIWRGVVRTTV